MDGKQNDSNYKRVAHLAVVERLSTLSIIRQFPAIPASTIRVYVSRAWRQAGQSPPVVDRDKSPPLTAPISSTHLRVGRRLALEASRREIPNNTQLASVSQVTTCQKLTALQRGHYDPTLTELQKIAAFCNLSVPDLLKGEPVVCQPTP